ncbi:hypothetical protein [Clostridium baratii]|uniref:hypothetical protein n=1 Tax=Clostridium baratii TaxID=1561 RepID=UPI0030CBF20B
MQTCKVCGCTEVHACEGGCYWIEWDLCNKCFEDIDKRINLNNVAVIDINNYKEDYLYDLKTEKYFSSFDEMKKHYTEENKKLPKYIYAVYFEQVKLDLERILEDACEDHDEDIEYSLDGVEELIQAIDKFNEVNSSVGTYNLDVDKVIKL